MILIGKEYRIFRLDEHNIVLEQFDGLTEKGNNIGKEKWKNKGYFGTVERAFKKLYNDSLNNSTLLGAEEAIQLSQALNMLDVHMFTMTKIVKGLEL